MTMMKENLLAAKPLAKPRNKRRKKWQALKRDRYLYLLGLPGILCLIIFKYIPMWGVLIAFQDYSPFKGLLGSEWVGLENFRVFFENPDFPMLLRNTIAINVMSLVFFFPVPIILSLMMNEVRNELFKRTIQSIVYLPHFLSWVIIAGLTFTLFATGEGLVNKILIQLGYEGVQWLTTPNYFWAFLTGQSVWKEAGWGTVIFLAAMANVDPQLYEAARMDGASRLRQMWNITIPAIQNVIIILLILKLGHIMDVGFEQVFLLQNAAVSEVADVFDTYIYRVGIRQSEFSYTTAVGLFKAAIGLMLVIISNKLVKKAGGEGFY
ncbi:ABC transporter permease [Paenibacillus mucilaginosus]|uniref:Binding-protein-dependent transport system inner membrane component n=3 Tax=Paenibacillus mucilaginosus TaxID=61624 RepID=H6NCQ4_9BACL|nr:sugar ABC transporter permease [Paenibacillus mucilaginosus]AEI40354.1 binding-protein-dependent transport system inner membrane component [Paenibacillus mucilaginosus KNP414]AFC28983.1 binding-protein-dependent transport system inner membrane component [Paenibacillus mucilaginosus 3016]AFH61208.2 protein lplB [Paenibacillus mucilaginosus K02]MCG7213288.1 sugar ABC transporter permease [Paenibacillus mucilaginosus]WDM29555.1 sugar ABC transporter permease [Paenibacillus mucilaginosus]